MTASGHWRPGRTGGKSGHECDRADDEDDIRVAPNDFRRQGFGARRVLLSAVTFNLEVLSLDLPQSPKLGE
jgi:hypothetical protein